jgi:hypothetical protein
MLPVAANREVYKFLRDGIVVQVRQPSGSLEDKRVALIDWKTPSHPETIWEAKVAAVWAHIFSQKAGMASNSARVGREGSG